MRFRRRYGGFDHRAAHISRFPLELDEQGRLDVARRLREVDDELARIAAGSRARAGDRGRPYEIVALGFDPARGDQRAVESHTNR
jgi:hypothetical protein